VLPLDDRAEDRGVRRRAADPALLEGADERRLGVTRRWGRRVRLGLEGGGAELVALRERRQLALLLVGRDRLVTALLVCLHQAANRDPRAGGAELGVCPVGGRGTDANRDGLAAGIGHLRGDCALPDQIVERGLVAVELAPQLLRRAEPVAGGPDRLVRLLGVLDLSVVVPRRVGDRLGSVQLTRLVAGR